MEPGLARKNTCIMIELNIDILIDVMIQIDSQRDISRMSRTCHSLHKFACQELLRRGVYLSTKRGLLSFYRFISNIGHTTRLLRQLSISMDLCKKFKRFSGLIARIIIFCAEVEEFTLERGYLLDADIRIGAAICTLQQLRTLEISWLGGVQNANIILSNLQSASLEAVHLTYHRFFDRLPSNDRDPTDGLHGFSASLTSLSLDAANFRVPNVDTPVCPQLTTLKLLECNTTGVAFLMYAFPNLRNLLLYGSDDYAPEDLDDDDAHFALTRVIPWKNLDYLTGSPHVVHSLRIPCPVYHWDVSLLSHYGEVDYLILAIEDLRVTQLALDLHREELQRFTALANSQALTHLVLTVEVKGSSEGEIGEYQVRSGRVDVYVLH